MSNFITLENSTLVTGATATGEYVSFYINDKKAAFPIYTFTSSVPDLDIVNLRTSNIIINNATFYTNSTGTSAAPLTPPIPYNAGVALTINGSAFAIPLYKINAIDGDWPELSFINPTIVSDLTANGQFLTMQIEHSAFGVPLYDFSTQYPFTSTVPQSSIVVSTMTKLEPFLFNIVSDPNYQDETGSTQLNNKIKTYKDVMDRIKSFLGYPTIKIDGCDEDIVQAIDQAMELYTKYAGYTEEYLIFCSNLYLSGCGIRLDKLFTWTPEMSYTCYQQGSADFDYDLKDYRKVIDCFSVEQGQGTGINSLFTIEQVVANQVYFGNLLGSNGFDLVTFDVLKGWLDTREKILAQTVYFRFDNRKQILRLIPEPTHQNSNYVGLIGCYVEKRVRDLIMEPWIIYYALALTKIKLGYIRGKYTFQLFAGGTLNYNDLLQQGLKEKEDLEKQLYTYQGLVENNPPGIYIG